MNGLEVFFLLLLFPHWLLFFLLKRLWRCLPAHKFYLGCCRCRWWDFRWVCLSLKGSWFCQFVQNCCLFWNGLWRFTCGSSHKQLYIFLVCFFSVCLCMLSDSVILISVAVWSLFRIFFHILDTRLEIFALTFRRWFLTSLMTNNILHRYFAPAVAK